MTLCRTLAEVEAAADADAVGEPPLTQAGADRVAAILWPARDKTFTRAHVRRVQNDIADVLIEAAREPSTP